MESYQELNLEEKKQIYCKRVKNSNFSPQFAFDDLFIPPFTKMAQYNRNGGLFYVPLSHDKQSTGIRILDDFRSFLMSDTRQLKKFCRSRGITIDELSATLLVLTGMNLRTLTTRWYLQTALQLLRYTELPLVDVATLSKLGTPVNLYYTCFKEIGCAPGVLRYQLREEGDEGRFEL